MGLEIYGVDFSGGKNPDIYYVYGDLLRDENGAYLRIWEWGQYDDRLDLFQHIIRSQANAMWALDFPFALPQPAYSVLGVKNWDELLTSTSQLTRANFLTWLEKHIPRNEKACEIPSVRCRVTDVVNFTKSPLKQVNPNLRAMIYGGFKILHYLKRYSQEMERSLHIFPFDPPYSPCLFEVYPSHTWRKVGMERTTHLREFVNRFNQLNLLEVILPPEMDQVHSQDLADSCVACITLATAIHQGAFANTGKPSFATDEEWAVRHSEGLIVRIENRTG